MTQLRQTTFKNRFELSDTVLFPVEDRFVTGTIVKITFHSHINGKADFIEYSIVTTKKTFIRSEKHIMYPIN